MKVVDFLRPELVIAQLSADGEERGAGGDVAHLAKHQTGVDPEALRKVLEERELLASTAIGDGIAIPHGKLDSVEQLVGTLGRSRGGPGVRFHRRQAHPPGVHAGGPVQLDRHSPQGAGPAVPPVPGRRLPPPPDRGPRRRRRCTRSSPTRTPSTERAQVEPDADPLGQAHVGPRAELQRPGAASVPHRAGAGAAGGRGGARPANHGPAHPEAGPGAGGVRRAGAPRAGADPRVDRARLPEEPARRAGPGGHRRVPAHGAGLRDRHQGPGRTRGPAGASPTRRRVPILRTPHGLVGGDRRGRAVHGARAGPHR